jgi:hypothetical protein
MQEEENKIQKLREELHYYRSESDKPPRNFKFIPKAVYTDDERLQELKEQIEAMKKRIA